MEKMPRQHSQKPYRAADDKTEYNRFNRQILRCFFPVSDFVLIHVVKYVNGNKANQHGCPEYPKHQ